MNSTQSSYTRNRATGVSFAGPEPIQNRDGDEMPEWSVCLIDDDGEPTGTIYRVLSYARGLKLAQDMARDRRLELVVDADHGGSHWR